MLTSPSLIIICSLMLIITVVFDLKSRRVPNTFVVFSFITITLSQILLINTNSLLTGLTALALAFLITLPLVMAGIIGGGDMKVLMLVGLCSYPDAVLQTALYSLVWGGLFGVVLVLLNGEIKVLVNQMTSFAIGRSSSTQAQFHVPFTVALFLGWLSHLHLAGVIA